MDDERAWKEAGVRLMIAASRERPEQRFDDNATEVSDDDFARVDVMTATKDFERFASKMKSSPVFAEKVGFIKKMEWSRWSGYHFHCAFFYDGSKVKNAYLIAEKIGALWGEVTAGRGYFHNCHHSLWKYRRVGIGVINHHDNDKRKALLEALSYLAKEDQYVRVKASKKARVFQTGIIPDVTKKYGRPRKSAHVDPNVGWCQEGEVNYGAAV